MQDQTITKLAIMETLNRYAWGYDTRDLDLMGNAFASEGSFDIQLAGSEGWGPYKGRQAIVEWLGGIMESQTDQRRHCVTNLIFRELTATRALAESYLVLTAVENGELQVVCTGTYHDQMILEDGQWLIAHKTLKLDNPF